MIRHVFILNPAAGKRNLVKDATERIKSAFILNTTRENEKYEILLTREKGDATRLAREACQRGEGFVRIYACGGDGTLNEVVNGVAEEKNAAICPIPLGSGNDFIRSFPNVPKECFLDLSACIRGEDFPCDVLKCDDIYSLNNISVGLDALTAKRQQKVKRIPLVPGGAAYKVALGYSFLSSMKNPIQFIVDGNELDLGDENITLGVLGNGQYYGGGFRATPYAKLDDGKIDFITVPAIRRMEFLKYVGDYKNGKHIETMPTLYYAQCERVKMISPQPITLQADGEIFEKENPEIEIVPGAIRLILPKEAQKISC